MRGGGAAAAAAALALASAAQAAAPPAMALGAAVSPPAGFLEFCRRQPQDCGGGEVLTRMAAIAPRDSWRARFAAARTSAPGAIGPEAEGPAADVAEPAPLTPELWTAAQRINAAVNRAMVRRSDLAVYGMPDRWATPLEAGRREGDCEDYVLEKRRALLAAGVPAEALHIALVETRRGEAHAVLLLATDRGERVLDNLTPWILPWAETGYRWRQRQVGPDPLAWVSVPAGGRAAAY